jgi:S-adenosylmethionine decarboxylase
VQGGTAWVIDAYGCDPDRLRDLDAVGALLDEVVRALELHVVAPPQRHRFPDPGGVTALYLLSESHLAIHTFPESGVATLDLYCCRPRPGLDWAALCADRLGAARVTVRELRRGDGP